MFADVRAAVQELSLKVKIDNIGNLVKIAEYGIMMTPSLVIDGQLVVYGKLLKVKDTVKMIKQKL